MCTHKCYFLASCLLPFCVMSTMFCVMCTVQSCNHVMYMILVHVMVMETPIKTCDQNCGLI